MSGRQGLQVHHRDSTSSSSRSMRRSGTSHSLAFAQRSKSVTNQLELDEKQTLLESVTILPPVAAQIASIFTGSYLNVLLVGVPISFLSYFGGWTPATTFAFSFLSLIPLAAMLGTFTEDLALRSNEAFGALLNATFGNATEMIISIFALKNNMNQVIQNSLIGSILGNMLLVLGCSLLTAGLYRHVVKFNSSAVNVYCSLLLLATSGLIIPTIFSLLPNQASNATLSLSREISVAMCIGYVCFLLFQLRTHKAIFDSIPDRRDDGDSEEEEEEAESPQFSTFLAIAALAVTTILISFESEFLVDSLEPAAHAWGLSQAFVSVILLPIVGNAAEHATAVIMAMHNKMDIAVGVAVGSSLQIALLVIPFLVIVSWFTGHTLDLNFQPFNVIIMFISVMITIVIVADGLSHWLEGILLLLVYIIVALSYLHTADAAVNPLSHGAAAAAAAAKHIASAAHH